MARQPITAQSDRPAWAADEEVGFDVLVQRSIGRIELRRDGEHPAHVAAMMLIAEQDTPGEYSYPLPDGGRCIVIIEHQPAV